jgi:hypothetical protein
MQSHEDTGGAIVVTYDSTSLSILLAVVALVGVGMAGYDSFIGSHAGVGHSLGQELTGAAVFALLGLVLREKLYFRFDPVEKLITWTRRGVFRHREGVIAFDDVRAVEVPIGDDDVPSRRICLRLADRSILPLATAFHGDRDNSIFRLAGRLRMVLGQPEYPSVMESAQSLVDAGRTVEAVRLLIEGEGLSRIDAKTRVDEMRK